MPGGQKYKGRMGPHVLFSPAHPSTHRALLEALGSRSALIRDPIPKTGQEAAQQKEATQAEKENKPQG